MLNSKIILLEPVLKTMIWGTESWGISAHPNGDCKVVSGPYQGYTLSSLWDEHRELFGDVKMQQFPLLTKVIDAKQDLSIQVHPNDAYANTNENGSLGKTECWYIMDCDPETTIVIGHHATTREELEDMIATGRWDELIREIPVKKGDFFQINPGCVHAIKGGTTILETQQNSDITYRLYDYDRLQDGQLRPLHIRQSMDVMTVPFDAASVNAVSKKSGWLEQLIACDYYRVWKGVLRGEETLSLDAPFVLGSVIDGEVMIDKMSIKKGMHFIIPSGVTDVQLKGNGELIFSTL